LAAKDGHPYGYAIYSSYTPGDKGVGKTPLVQRYELENCANDDKQQDACDKRKEAMENHVARQNATTHVC
jgi:DNA topoisomerase VI subunit A